MPIAKNTKICAYILAAIFAAYVNVNVNATYICGNYCGPNWCNGADMPENICNTTVPPDPAVLHADTCCRQHDACCGHGDRRTCNDALIACILNKPGGGKFTDADTYTDGLICGDNGYVIAEFFKLLKVLAKNIENATMCCASPCAS
jgi:hypothetical protein